MCCKNVPYHKAKPGLLMKWPADNLPTLLRQLAKFLSAPLLLILALNGCKIIA